MQWIIDETKRYLKRRGRKITEGSASAEELEFFVRTLRENPGIRLVGEIGFNAGFSSYAFLYARKSVRVVSFDIGTHTYVKDAKEFIDKRFPGRHAMVWGDSKTTVPRFTQHNPNIKCGLIFIDGGHDYKTAMADIRNMKKLATKDTLLVVDDLTPWLEWGKGPTKAWQKAIKTRLICKTKLYKNGIPVKSLKGQGTDRIWGVGHYQV